MRAMIQTEKKNPATFYNKKTSRVALFARQREIW